MEKVIIAKEDSLVRLDKFLVAYREDLSRSAIKKMIEKELVLVNGASSKPNYLIKEDDVLTIEELELETYDMLAQDIPIEIVYQDEDIAIINKPSGMVVHPGAGAYSDTLVNALLFHIKDLSGINGEIRPGIVHRIDKETSGLLVVAKNDKAHRFLADQLVDKSLNRTYLALVHGQIFDENIVIDAPIGRDRLDRTKMTVTANNSKKALTKIKVLEIYENHSFVQATLDTGRTHQIRVHMNYIKHPVVGDPKYGFRKDNKDHGQYLHAYKLGLIHPSTKEYMEFSVDLPEEFLLKQEELKNEKPKY